MEEVAEEEVLPSPPKKKAKIEIVLSSRSQSPVIPEVYASTSPDEMAEDELKPGSPKLEI